MGKPEDQILQLLKNEKPLTLVEIAEKLDLKPKIVYKSLRKLFENNEISCDTKTRRYTVAKEE
jgi:predicted transcriptional regulator